MKYIYRLIVFIFIIVIPYTAVAQTMVGPTQNTQESGFQQTMTAIASQVFTFNNPVSLKEPRDSFKAAENPVFTLSIPEKIPDGIGEVKVNEWQTGNEQIQVELTNLENEATMAATIKKVDEGKFEVIAEKGKEWVPGSYHLEISAKETFFYTRDLSQDFSWGVLAINTNKSIYTPGETAKLAFGVIDEKGHTLCHEDLSLIIRAPDGKITNLSTQNGGIRESGECSGDSVTILPDYLAQYKTAGTGKYQMTLTGTNDNGTHTITDYFEVRDNPDFDIERTKFPTRVYPISAYDVEIKVKANKDYTGPVTEIVPKAFLIENISGNGTIEVVQPKIATMAAEVLEQDTEAYKNIESRSKLMYEEKGLEGIVDKTPTPITWNVNWKAGETHTLSYRINFPVVSPEFFLIGPLSVGDFAEIRQWQVANDAARTWDGGGADENWNTPGNWSSNLVPGSSDSATFNGTSTKNCTINISITVNSLSLDTNYTGTVTQASTNTITTDNTGGFNMNDGTFAGGSGDISIEGSGDFTMTSGVFTNTSGVMWTDTGGFTVSGGTYNHNNGTVAFWGSMTITGTFTQYNATFIGDAFLSYTYTLASTTNMTVTNTLDFDAEANATCTISGTGIVSLQGNLTMSDTLGCSGTGTVEFSGSGTQTISGGSTSKCMPTLSMNKSGGTVTMNSDLCVRGNVSYTQGPNITGSSYTMYVYTNGSNKTISGGPFYVPNLQFSADAFLHGEFNFQTGARFGALGTLTLNTVTNGDCILNGPGQVEAQGTLVTSGSSCSGTADVAITGSGSPTITDSVSGFPGDLIIDTDAASVTSITSSIVLSTEDLIIRSGKLNAAGKTITLSSSTLQLETNGTIQVNGNESTIPTPSSNTGTVELVGTSTYTSLPFGTTYYGIRVNGTGTYSPASNLILNGSFTMVQGTFNAPSNLSIGGDITLTGGTFNIGSNTITIINSVATSTLNDSITFYNLVVSGGNKTIILDDTQTFAVSNSLSINASAEAPVYMESLTPGVQATFDVTYASPQLSGVVPTDIDSCGGYIIYVTQGGSGGNVSCWSFSPPGYYDPAWTVRKKIVFDADRVSSGPHTNFPALITFSADSSLNDNAQADGDDILFTDANGTTLLDFEIESYSTGTLVAWVLVPTLSSTIDTTIYMYYGNAAAASSLESAANTWDEYIGVWHMDEDPSGAAPQLVDWTGNGHNGTSGGTMTSGDEVAGKIGNAIDFDGSNDYFNTADTTHLDTIDTAISVSAWVTDNGNNSGWRGIINRPVSSSNSEHWALHYFDNEPFGGVRTGTDSSSGLDVFGTETNSVWAYYTLTWNGTTVTFYRNGAFVASDTVTGTIPDDTVGVDMCSNVNTGARGEYCVAILDEMRLTNVSRSAGWILTEYNNQDSPSTFYTATTATEGDNRVKIYGGTKINTGVRIDLD